MNERNVEALAELLDGYRAEESDVTVEDGELSVSINGINRSIAHYLAAQGVLVPSALTDHQTTPLFEGELESKNFPDEYTMRDAVIVYLERIAKGEAEV
jgi:hypothetical protein